MEDQLVNFETAKLAKEKGFNISVYFFWHPSSMGDILLDTFEETQFGTIEVKENHNQEYTYRYSAPTQSLLQKWLREVHKIFVTINAKGVINEIVWYNNITIRSKKDHKFENYHKTYEKALEEGLQEGLKLISNEL